MQYKKSKKQVEINWKNIDNSIGYVVYKSDSTKIFKPVSGQLIITQMNDEKVIPNKIYYYKIKSFFTDGSFAESVKKEILIQE